jgi:hypothetical protein
LLDRLVKTQARVLDRIQASYGRASPFIIFGLTGSDFFEDVIKVTAPLIQSGHSLPDGAGANLAGRHTFFFRKALGFLEVSLR